jgi:hypothetical protein
MAVGLFLLASLATSASCVTNQHPMLTIFWAVVAIASFTNAWDPG